MSDKTITKEEVQELVTEASAKGAKAFGMSVISLVIAAVSIAVSVVSLFR